MDVLPDGSVTYLERFSTNFQLNFDFTLYPFDVENFYIHADMLYPEDRYVMVPMDGFSEIDPENGEDEFSYTPARRSIEETLREVGRCTRDGITINTFMLARARALAEFVALVTRLNRGRAFYATPEHLGEYVLVDFVSGRTRGVG